MSEISTMTESANWTYPTTIRFGAGRVAELAGACAAASIERPLFVTDRGLAESAIAARALDVLEQAGLGRAVFAQVDPNPHDGNLAAGIEAYRAGAHDGVVAFGGGSALDLGKLIAFQHGQSAPVWEFEDVGDRWKRADRNAIAPIVAVPTTAGTGSEVGRAGVLTDRAREAKIIVFHPAMLPACVIADPELTVGMPPAITVGSGMDALAHCIEAYSAPSFHPMSHGIALEGMRLVFDNLPRVARAPRDLEARGRMMAAAMMGAVAFQKGLGAVHALSHPIGARFHTHHGMTNAVLIPAVLEFNREAIEPAIARAAAYCAIDGGFEGFVDRIRSIARELGVPAGLGALGVERAALERLASEAPSDPTAAGNPRPLDSAAALALLEASF